nr:nickel-dependent hydrogenase large subunit [Gemmatimonadaceae bacterium]
SWADFQEWLDESPAHRNSDLGFYVQVAQAFGQDTFGQGLGRYLAYGTYLHKDMWNRPTIESRNDALISPSGVFDGDRFHVFDHLHIQEHVNHSWYKDEPALHPWKEPAPSPVKATALAHTDMNGKYSWAKAPRYADTSVEVGPLARMIMAGNPANKAHQTKDPLVLDMLKRQGPSIFLRSFARLHEIVRLWTYVDTWLTQIDLDKEFYIPPVERDGQGFGATEAARGALAHWIEVEDGKIKNYQMMAPTTWNVGPRDGKERPGAIEAALTGIPIENPKDPVEVAMVCRSFDSCIVCTVHAHDAATGEPLAEFKVT